MKKKSGILLAVVLVLIIPVIFSAALMLTNNFIADRVEKDLTAIELPDKTELADSLSIAAKVYGNGNGMQYIGELLITSELSEQELNGYYQSFNENITVKKQYSSQVIDGEFYERYQFDGFDEAQNNYAVELVSFNPATFEDLNFSNLLWKILDWDIRGH